MNESAKALEKGVGVRDRRKAATRASLSSEARKLTAAQGLNGFTIEELCESVGVSRRTFFNYFPSKEDAVIGHADEGLDEELIQEFLDAREPGLEGISPFLLRDLTVLSEALMQRIGFSVEEARTFSATVKREPQLLVRLLRTGEERSRAFAEVVARREGVSVDHPVVIAAVVAFGALTKHAADCYFQAGNHSSFGELLQSRIAGAQQLFGGGGPHR